jgi:ubiquinol-cytochrome c reductase cytochrome c1 subunit
MRKTAFLPAWALLVLGSLTGLSATAAEESTADWTQWRAGNSVADLTSVQSGARNFASFCLGCHSLQYERWARLGQDLKIPADVLQQTLVPAGEKSTDYILTSMPPDDAAAWFGKAPPDLSLMVRARGRDYVYRFLKTFYIDPTRQTGANNLQLPATAMPAVLSDLQGLQRAVFKNVEIPGSPSHETEAVFDHFEQVSAGRLTPEEYDRFVRDTVNFLDYVSEPAQTTRVSLGVWVVLFLLVFTWIAWLMKKEYWKDVH